MKSSSVDSKGFGTMAQNCGETKDKIAKPLYFSSIIIDGTIHFTRRHRCALNNSQLLDKQCVFYLTISDNDGEILIS